MDDWFSTLLNTGNIAIGAARDVGVAQAQGDAATMNYAASLANAQNAFAQNLVLKQSTGVASFQNNLPLILMLGVAAFFIINQSNK